MFGFPLPIVRWIVEYGIGLIIVAMLIRALASWVRIDERNAFIRFLARLTDPFIDPVRRIVPSIGMINLSFIIAWFLLLTLQTLLLQALPYSW